MNNLITIFTTIVLFTLVLTLCNIISHKNMTKILLVILPLAIITLSKEAFWPTPDINNLSHKTTQTQKSPSKTIVNTLTGKKKSHMASEQDHDKVSMELTFLDDNLSSQTTLIKSDNQFELFGLIEKICVMSNDRIIKSNIEYDKGKIIGERHVTEHGHTFFIYYYGQSPKSENI